MQLRFLVTRIFCFIALFAGACESTPKDGGMLSSGDSVTVVQIVKGDEFIVNKGSSSLPIRLLGIYTFAPVISDSTIVELAHHTHAWAVDTLQGKSVTVELSSPPKDAHERYLTYIRKDGADIGQRIVEEGHGMVYTEYSFQSEQNYMQAEKTARDAGKGLWSSEKATKLAKGLREQWRDARKRRGDTTFRDDLLQPKPTTVKAQAAEHPSQ